MAQATTGNKVKVHYTGKLEDGTVFDSSHDGDPLEFTIGEKMLIAGFENAVMGMEIDETKSVSIPPEEGYGEHHSELVAVIGRENVPAEINPEVGQVLQVRSEDGSINQVVVTEVTDENVTLDGNHPLAGRELIFEITLVEIA